MLGIGIDVSKGKSTVCILQHDGKLIKKPFTLTHTKEDIYLYIKKKESEGKPKKSSKIAGLNKFLRIYYAKVRDLTL